VCAQAETFHDDSLAVAPLRVTNLIFEIEQPEFVLCTVEQHSQVTPVYAKRTTDLIFVLFLQEDSPKQLLVSLWQITQYAADVLLGFTG